MPDLAASRPAVSPILQMFRRRQRAGEALEDGRLLKLSDAAAYLGMSRRRLLLLIQRGDIPSVRFGHKGWHKLRWDQIRKMQNAK
jgi:excisionase family DNA binding protein